MCPWRMCDSLECPGGRGRREGRGGEGRAVIAAVTQISIINFGWPVINKRVSCLAGGVETL